MGFLEGNSDVLERLVMEMYARGMSTRDVEYASRDFTGQLVISGSAVSEITDPLWEQYKAFVSRDLSGIAVEYLFCDGIYESLRRHGAKEAILVAWGIDSDGRKHLLHLAVGNKESEACWAEFFRHMVARGLRMPTSVTADGAPGLIRAIGAVFGSSVRIRCWYHRLGNIRTKLPDDDAPQVMAEVRAIRDAPTLDAARAQADRVLGCRWETTSEVGLVGRAEDLFMRGRDADGAVGGKNALGRRGGLVVAVDVLLNDAAHL
jgi:transposase-like protein